MSFKILKNPLNTKGIPFIAYKNTGFPFILHLILEVGTSESNSFSSGTKDVWSLDWPNGPTNPDCGAVLLLSFPSAWVAVDCWPNCNWPPDTILTLAP